MSEMDFSIEGLSQQAMVAFATLQGLIPLLPAKLTPEVEASIDSLPFIEAIRKNRVFADWIMQILAYNNNKSRGNTMGMVLYVCPFQLATLAELETLSSQMMIVSTKDIERITLPEMQLKGAAHVIVRLELFLTQNDDTKRLDMRVYDPAGKIEMTPKDIKTASRRLGREIQKLAATEKSSRSSIDISNLEAKIMRVCANCKKYGVGLGKCSGCMQVYYCTEECQKIDWKKGHRTVCSHRPGIEPGSLH